jgi:transmembrane 9 superfamily protein 2/4
MKAIISTIASILSGEYACGLKLQLGEAQPRSYVDGEPVELLVNKLTSEKTLMPLDYYDFPFCMSRDGSESKEQNVGQFLAGDRIRLSPYRIRMKEDMYCEQLCIADLGQAEKVGAATNKAALAIRNNYHHNWIIDNIPAASKIEDVSTVTTRYWGGFPLGFVDSDTRKSYVHNHVNIEIQYHPLEDDLNRSRIVRFTVQQFSIKHQFETVDDEEAERIARIIDPVESCSPEKRPKHRTFYDHTRYEMLYSRGREPQPASGKVLFTYDVIWIENKELDWPSRWDIYVTMSNSIPDRVHWFSICNSLVVTSVLLGIVCAILVRNLRRDAILPITDEEKAESISRFGWKLIHGDVFRPPSSPLLLSICCGTGSQLLSTTFWSVVLSLSGFIHPSKRGYFATAILVLYALNASLAGYVTARLYRDFGGKYHRRAMLGAAVGFTGLASGVWFFLYEVALKNSTYAVPAKILFFIFCLMFFVSTPLALVGSHFGFKRPVMGLPVRTSSFPRPIPPQPWVRRLPLAAITGIVINFGVIFVEFSFICGALWGGQYYFSYGFLIAVLCILATQCALTAILFNFIQLFGENYANWHWRAFIVGGSAGFGVFFYSWCSNPLQSMSSIGTSAIYFGFMGLISLAILLMTGFIGKFTS